MIRMTSLLPVLVCMLLAGCQCAKPPTLSTFKFDGCSCFPEGDFEKPDLWEQDCLNHDIAYWQGGSREERKSADLKLREGIRTKGKPLVADIVYLGVRIGGSPWLRAPWRWGFGWSDFPRGYRELSDEERLEIAKIFVSPSSAVK